MELPTDFLSLGRRSVQVGIRAEVYNNLRFEEM